MADEERQEGTTENVAGTTTEATTEETVKKQPKSPRGIDFEKRLGRMYTPDTRDALFPLRSVTQKPAEVPSHREWYIPTILDQGNKPECVAYSARMALESSPHLYKRPNPTPDELYKGAQENDEWAGEGYDGTSARGVMKYMKQLGLIASYYWAKTVDEALLFTLTTGPVMVGGKWQRSMNTPDSHGLIHLDGDVIGGHEVLLRSYNQRTELAGIANPWGPSWGHSGIFFIHRSDFIDWFKDDGDLVAFVETPYAGER